MTGQLRVGLLDRQSMRVAGFAGLIGSFEAFDFAGCSHDLNQPTNCDILVVDNGSFGRLAVTRFCKERTFSNPIPAIVVMGITFTSQEVLEILSAGAKGA